MSSISNPRHVVKKSHTGQQQPLTHLKAQSPIIVDDLSGVLATGHYVHPVDES